MDGGSVFGRKSAARTRPCCSAVGEGRERGAGRHHAEVGGAEGRQARSLRHLPGRQEPGKTTRSSFTDTKVVPGKTYRYAIRAYGKDKKAGVLSPSVRVKVPLQASTKLPSNPGGRRPTRSGRSRRSHRHRRRSRRPTPDPSPTADPPADADRVAHCRPRPRPRRPLPADRPTAHGDRDRDRRRPRATATPTATATATPTATATATPTATATATPTATATTPRPRPRRRRPRPPRPQPPRRATATATATATPTATPTATATPTPVNPDNMAVAMVDRLFWRAGFGPTQDQRTRGWARSRASSSTGSSTRPSSLDVHDAAAAGPRRRGRSTRSRSSVELELEWIDRMQRAVNPLPERLAFFWHRHWAISRDDGSVSDKWVFDYRNRLLEYADFGTYPDATFKQLAYEMTTQERGDVVVPEHQPEHEDQAERELRARVHGAVLPRPEGRRTATTTTRRPTSPGSRRRSRAGRSTAPSSSDGVTPNPDYGKITFSPAASRWRPRRSSAARSRP